MATSSIDFAAGSGDDYQEKIEFESFVVTEQGVARTDDDCCYVTEEGDFKFNLRLKWLGSKTGFPFLLPIQNTV